MIKSLTKTEYHVAEIITHYDNRPSEIKNRTLKLDILNVGFGWHNYKIMNNSERKKLIRTLLRFGVKNESI